MPRGRLTRIRVEGSIVVVEIEMFEGLCMDLKYETVEMITDVR